MTSPTYAPAPPLPLDTVRLARSVSKPVMPTTYEPAVYFLWLSDVLVYVGQSRDVGKRIAQHWASRTKPFDAATYMRCHPMFLRDVEADLIRKLKPLYNKQRPRR